MIECKNERLFYVHKKRIIKEIKEYKSNPTAEDVLDHLLGDSDYRGDSMYGFHYYEDDERTVLNRIAMSLFIIPFIVSMPIQWLFLGRTGVRQGSKFGRLIDKLIKF